LLPYSIDTIDTNQLCPDIEEKKIARKLNRVLEFRAGEVSMGEITAPVPFP